MTQAKPTESLMTELRSLPRPFWVLVGGWFINRFGTFVFPFLTLFLKGNGHGAGAIAWVLSAHGLGQFMSSLLGGYLADRFGRRGTLAFGAMASGASVFALYFAHELWVIVGCMWLAGMFSGIYMPASSALLADIVPERMRLRAYAVQRVAINAGFACGSSAGGFIIKVSAFWLFAGDAMTTVTFGIVALLMLPVGVRAAGDQASWGEAWRVLRADQAFWALFAATVMTSFVFQQFNSTFALEVQVRGATVNVFGWQLTPEEVFGCVLGWNGLMVTLFELPVTRWTQRFDSRRVIMAGYAMLGGGFAMNALPGGAPLFFMAMTVFTIGEMLSQPMRSAYVAELAPEHMRGRYMGALAMGATVAGVFGPHISLRLHASHPTALWVGCGVLGVLAALTLEKGK